MAIDQVPEEAQHPKSTLGSRQGVKFTIIYLVLALLALNEIHTLSKLSSFRESFESQEAKLRKELSAQLDDRLNALEQSNAQVLERFKKDVEMASKNSGSTRKDLRRERELINHLEAAQAQQAQQVKAELAQKADQQQVGALTEDVSATRTDLDNTKKMLDATRHDVGMARSEFGTLIARNHDEIEQLRKLGGRDYFEFTLGRKTPQHIANVGFVLKGTNVKRHKFNLILQADDMEIEKKNRTINEPIFFYVGGSKRPFELVINAVQSGQVKGYLSTPKGAVQTASTAPSGN